eukprot:353414-Chlamydomonas_euryale.AAC.21
MRLHRAVAHAAHAPWHAAMAQLCSPRTERGAGPLMATILIANLAMTAPPIQPFSHRAAQLSTKCL